MNCADLTARANCRLPRSSYAESRTVRPGTHTIVAGATFETSYRSELLSARDRVSRSEGLTRGGVARDRRLRRGCGRLRPGGEALRRTPTAACFFSRRGRTTVRTRMAAGRTTSSIRQLPMESHDWGFAGGDAERARILGGLLQPQCLRRRLGGTRRPCSLGRAG